MRTSTWTSTGMYVKRKGREGRGGEEEREGRDIWWFIQTKIIPTNHNSVIRIIYLVLDLCNHSMKACVSCVKSTYHHLYVFLLLCCSQKKQRESAAKVWAVLKNCITVLGIAAEEEKALWSLLAAIYHLGYAAVKRSEKMQARGGDRFMNPAASQRAAAVLGISHEDLGHFIFSPPRGVSMRISSNTFGATATSPGPADDVASQSPSITSLMGGSPFLGRSSGWDALSSFCMGLYEQAFNALVLLINRYVYVSVAHV